MWMLESQRLESELVDAGIPTNGCLNPNRSMNGSKRYVDDG